VSAYLIDADVTISALKGRTEALATIQRLAPEGIALSVVTLGELYEGAFGVPDSDAHLASLRAFVSGFEVLSLDDAIVERFARVRAQLRREGRLIPDLDILMGVTAVHHDLTLLTRNVRHLNRIPGIRIFSDTAAPPSRPADG